MITLKSTLLLLPLAGLMGFAAPSTPSIPAALPVGSHTWDFTEVFSNADGTIQFIELKECCGGAGETGLPGHTLSSNGNSWVIPGPALTAPTSSKHFLIATAGFAALPGAPTPDRIIPAGSVPFLSSAGDTLTYVPWDTWTFGNVPIDGVNSLKRNGTISINNPTNYAGATGTVIASSSVPAMSTVNMVVLGVLVLLAGSAVLIYRRPLA